MAKKTKDSNLSLEEKLEQALIPNWDEPYKLPDNWCWTKLSAISLLERGITFPASAKESSSSDTNIPCLRTANVQETLELSDLLYVDRTYMKGNADKLIRENDILMSTANSRELVGKTSFVHLLTEEMTFGGFIMAIRSKINPKYLFYFLRLQFLNGKFMGNSTQTTNIANINSTSLGETETPIPPFDEQQRIVSRIESLFAKLDEAKEKAQEVVDGFDTRKAAILHKAFSGELTQKWREENGVEFGSWKISSIDELCHSLKYGTSKKSKSEGPVVVIRMGNLQQGEIDWTDLAYTDEQEDIEKYKLNPGDVLFNRTNSAVLVGKTSIYRGEYPAIFAGYLIKLDYDHERILGEYLNYSLNTTAAKEYCNSVKTDGVNQSNINAKKIGAFEIPVAPFSEQKEIVRIIKSLLEKENQSKETAETVIEQIDTMKKAILARAFRGELGTNDPTEESAVELVKEVLLKSDDSQSQEKPKRKRIAIPKEVADLLTTQLEKTIIKLFYKSENGTVSVGDIMSVSSKKFEIMDTIRSLEEKKIIRENIELIRENNESIFTLMR